MKSLAVAALGGHAILPKAELLSVGKQLLHIRQAIPDAIGLVTDEWNLDLTHGNGPQVGHILARSERPLQKISPYPLCSRRRVGR